MKTKALLALVFPVLLFLTACDFTAPLTEKPTRDVDPALFGSWFSITNGEPLEIYRLSATEYLAVIDKDSPFVCTHSDMAGVAFISCRVIGQDAKEYGKYAYRAYKLDGDQLSIFRLSESLVDVKDLSAAERRARIEAAAKAGTALDTTDKNILRYKRKA